MTEPNCDRGAIWDEDNIDIRAWIRDMSPRSNSTCLVTPIRNMRPTVVSQAAGAAVKDMRTLTCLDVEY